MPAEKVSQLNRRTEVFVSKPERKLFYRRCSRVKFFKRRGLMKKLALACAGLATIVIAPSIASAAEFGVRVGGDRGMYRDGSDYRMNREFRGARAEYGYDRQDRGSHRGWYKDRGERTVIIKRRHRHWDD
jgi:hypothetical protein